MKRMSASEVKNHWGVFVKAVTDGDEDVVVENRREPLFVAISPESYERFQSLSRDQKLQQARERLKEIERLQAGRNVELTEEEIEEIGVRTAREIRHALDQQLYGQPGPTRER
jgi:prevent-host-death family protein